VTNTVAEFAKKIVITEVVSTCFSTFAEFKTKPESSEQGSCGGRREPLRYFPLKKPRFTTHFFDGLLR
jgi:hypothetical protein